MLMPLLPAIDPAQTRTVLALAVPAFYLFAILAGLAPQTTGSRWRCATHASAAAVVAAMLSLIGWAIWGTSIVRGSALLRLGDFGAVTTSLRSDAAGCLVLQLVTFIGWVIVRYSRTYLAGELRQARYVQALLATLAAVSVVVITNNFVVLALAWLATSLALHRLLTFYSDRPQAIIAAHKKFLASRIGDVCLVAAIALVGSAIGSLDIDLAVVRSHALPNLPPTLYAAGVLFAVSAMLKCAQLPIHGWLIQVMEAPTPVSALLHAGVVNLGGFLLIRIGTLVTDVSVAQAMLTIVGSVTAVVAALVMTTRISIKVMLAWSTCAQMGFMLMQCGLGAHGLALLHLVAHSCYKAHAFLSAGGAVEQARLRQMTLGSPHTAFATSSLGALAGLTIVSLAALTWSVHPSTSPAIWALAPIAGLALTPLLTPQALRIGGLWPIALVSSAFAVALAYFGLHQIFAAELAVGSGETKAGVGQIGWVAFMFTLLFVVQGRIRANPDARFARWLYPWFFNGLYLDEMFTRITFRVWPARLTPARDGALAEHAPATSGTRSW